MRVALLSPVAVIDPTVVPVTFQVTIPMIAFPAVQPTRLTATEVAVAAFWTGATVTENVIYAPLLAWKRYTSKKRSHPMREIWNRFLNWFFPDATSAPQISIDEVDETQIW